MIRANRGMPAETIISEIYEAVLEFSERVPQPDDLTMLVVKRM